MMWEVSSTQTSTRPTWDKSQVVHIADCSQNGAGNEMRYWRSTWLVQIYTTDCIRYDSGAWEYIVWLSPVVRQETRIKAASSDYADRDHRSVSRQHSECAEPTIVDILKCFWWCETRCLYDVAARLCYGIVYLLCLVTFKSPVFLRLISQNRIHIGLASCGFRHARPSVWNSLPTRLRSIDIWIAFKSNLTTH